MVHKSYLSTIIITNSIIQFLINYYLLYILKFALIINIYVNM